MNSGSEIESAFSISPLHLSGITVLAPAKATISSPYQEMFNTWGAQPSAFRKQYCPESLNPIIFAKLRFRLFSQISLELH
jgi:hypothetical protein